MSIELLDLSSSGIEFHSLGAATANALSPCGTPRSKKR